MSNKFLKFIIYPGICVTLLLLNACSESFLDLAPSNAVDLNSAIKTLDDYKAAVNGIYDGMQSSNYYGRYFILVPDVMSDDVKQNAQANRARDYADYTANVLDGIANGMFNDIYAVINRANTVINAEAEVPAAVESQKNQYVGEAYAARALAHFDLVRIYGQHYGYTDNNSQLGIPIVTTFDQDAKPSRNTVAEVYAQITSDLEQAVTLMTIAPKDAGHLSKEAALALLARVSLYKSDWAKAEQFASDVINSGRFSLESTDGYVASWNDDFSDESIFSIVFRQDDDNGSDALGRMYQYEGYGDYLPAEDVLNLIPAGDVRGELFKTDKNGVLRVNKYPNPTVQNNTPVIRLSEMYLIRAEARAMLNKESDAQADVSLIRQRGLPSADTVTATGQDLLNEIEKERRVELMFEGHRLWDLMRHKQGVFRTDCTGLTCEIPYPNDRFVFPIPQREIDANPNMTQNPGYGN